MWQRIKNFYHLLQALIANILYGFPARKMKIIGITGTDGKTTTASLLYHILHSAGYNVSLLTTVSAVINGKSYDTGFHVTTPSSFALQKYLKKAKNAGTEYFILETTSHALDQNRVFGIPYSIGVLTNITREHLDYHKTYDKYLKAKAKLLWLSHAVVLNKDDVSYKKVKQELLKHDFIGQIVSYGKKKDAVINTHNFPFITSLIGDFNTYNILAAASAARLLHIPDQKIKDAIKSFNPPVGRQEIVYKKDFTVIIDFAHTPNSFAEILPVVKKLAKGRLIHVFGCAGKRDKFKRPLMGEIASRYDDIIVLTAEDPRSEKIEKINEQIKKGIKNHELRIMNKTLVEITNRKDAIEYALSIAQKGDVVLTTGKSHERSINYGKGEIPWSEHGVIRDALKQRESHA